MSYSREIARTHQSTPYRSCSPSLCMNPCTYIQHMNHGPAFQALWWELRRDIRNLQNKGYYGDGQSLTIIFSLRPKELNVCVGYWSSGTRLADGAKVAGTGIQPGDLPQYMVRIYSLSTHTVL